MLQRICASLTLACACLVVANAKASTTTDVNEALPTPFEMAHMAYQGQFTQWGIPAAGIFCSDVNNTMLISQDLAYAYLLESGYVDTLLAPTEGAPASQAQVKGKDLPVSQGQAQVKIKDVPISQGQAQAKGKIIPPQQGQSSSIIRQADLDIRRFVDYTNALTQDEVRLVRENFDAEFLRDLNMQMRYMCNE
ncbi:MAG: hypothetical protein FJY29_12080 [Betaproteobacteria bacterium]|nr:hypothetical protein [Betaproteobacteria bacterium]